MKKFVVCVFIALSIVILAAVLAILSNPLRRSEGRIKASMLKLTPVGTSMEEVVSSIKNNKKLKIRVVYQNGVYAMDGEYPRAGDLHIFNESLQLYLGSYRTIFETGVTILYSFDGNSNLTGISVRKDRDSL